MPKKITQEELRAISDVIERSEFGMSIDRIEKALGGSVTRRTLSRRLADLVAEGTVTSIGKGKATRYLPARPEPDDGTMSVREAGPGDDDYSIGISRESESIIASIRRPMHLRNRVGYRRDFLDAYIPDETFYLPEATRRELTELGAFKNGPLPTGTYRRRVYNRLLIELSWNSSRLEGNTYSLLETERLVRFGQTAEGKLIDEALMIMNHKAAIEMLVDGKEQIRINRHTVLGLHAVLSEKLMKNPDASGRLRAIPVGIGGTTYMPPEIPQLIGECFEKILQTAQAIADPLEAAFFLMVHLPYLQPFEDVNKRTSRLAANIPLIHASMIPLSFVDVPQRVYVDAILGVYELNRVELLRDLFVWSYKRSCVSYSDVRSQMGEPDPFFVRHRTLIKDAIGTVLRHAMKPEDAWSYLGKRAEELELADRPRFMQMAREEFSTMTAPHFMRYRLTPSDFDNWKANWEG